MKRTTIEIDQDVLARAKKVLGLRTTRATVEEALRQVADRGEAADAQRRELQLADLARLGDRLDLDVLASGEAWR